MTYSELVSVEGVRKIIPIMYSPKAINLTNIGC